MRVVAWVRIFWARGVREAFGLVGRSDMVVSCLHEFKLKGLLKGTRFVAMKARLFVAEASCWNPSIGGNLRVRVLMNRI
jgi:hypothetical protein